jgi:FMN phosphatase YigB (HAD superfamily)
MPPIKTLIFDIGGVLLDIHPEKIYELILDKIVSSGEKVLYIDDNEENIEGAKNSGMNAVIYEGLERLIETLEDFEISMTHPIII